MRDSASGGRSGGIKAVELRPVEQSDKKQQEDRKRWQRKKRSKLLQSRKRQL